MSFNRENVTWQSQDGTWSIGFFTVSRVDPEGDPEWDVEYDMNSFEWASTGHRSADAADDAWDGANPGGGWVHPYTEATAEAATHYDAMAAELAQRRRAAR